MKNALLASSVAVLLSACSSGGTSAAPSPLAPVSPSVPASAPAAATTPAYSPAPLPQPRSSTALDREVERAVLAYFAGINRLFATGDSTAFDASYTASCTTCRQFSRQVTAEYAAGQRDDARDEVVRLVVAGGGSQNAGAATVTFRVPPHRIVQTDGTEVGSYPESSATRIFTVVRTPGGFKVAAIQDPSK